MDRSWRARARRTQRSLGAMCLLVVAALVAGSLVGVVADTATAPPAAAAGTCKDWVATGSEALWTDGANWSPAGVPGATDCIRSQSVTDMLVDTNVTITFWQQSEFLNTVRITNDAAFRLTSTEFGSTINEVVGESGELIADNTTSTRINRIVVPAANTFTIGGPSPITIGGGFVAGTLRVGKTATTGVGARNADVSMSLATLLPGDVVVDGPSLGRLRLTGSTPNTGLGGDYQGSITNGAKGATTLAVDARLTVKDSQTLQITGPFTVESTVDGSGGTVDVDAGGRVTFDAGLTNYAAAADALTGGRWDVGGRIDLPGPLMANRADVIYRGGDFFHANAVTRPTRNERLLRIASDMTFAGLLNLVGPLAKTPVLIVGTDVTEPYVPTTLTVTNPGLQSQAGGVVEVRQGHAVDCAVDCTFTDTQVTFAGDVEGEAEVIDAPGGLTGTVGPGFLALTRPRGHIDRLVATTSTVAFDLSNFVPDNNAYFDVDEAVIGGTLRLVDDGTEVYEVGDQLPIIQSATPIVGSFAKVDFQPLANGLTWDLVTTPTTITAVVRERSVAEFTATAASVAEGTGADVTRKATVRLDQPFGYPTEVVLFRSGGTATVPGDVTIPAATANKVVIPTNTTQVDVDMTVTADAVDELDETVGISLGSNVFATPSPTAGIHTLTIVNDDATAPVISVQDLTKSEGSVLASNANVTVTRTGSTTQTATVQVATANGTATAGSDYTAVSTTVTFGVGETTKVVPVSVAADIVPEPNETFFVGLKNAINASIGTANATVTITNDDGAMPEVSVADVSIVEGTGGSKTATVTVTRTGSLVGSIGATVAVAGGTASPIKDFTASTTNLTFGNGVATRTIAVPIVTDAIAEPTELINVKITGTTNALVGQGSAAVSIRDDDPALQFAADAVAVDEDDSGTSTVTLVLTRSTTLGPATATVKANTANGTAAAPGDYIATGISGTTATFASGSPTATATIQIVGDQVSEADETFTVTLSSPSAGAVLGDLKTTTVTIRNDDGALPELNIADQAVTEPGATTAGRTVRVTRKGSTDGLVTFRATATAGTATSPGDLITGFVNATIQPGASFADVTFQIVGDTVPENDETFTVTLSNVVGASVGDGVGTVTIRDDDPRITVDSTTVTVDEGDSGLGVATVTLRRSTTLGPATPSVRIATANGTATGTTDYVSVANTLVIFPAGSPTATVNLGINGDTTVEEDETFTATISQPSAGATIGAPATATVTIRDDDGPRFHPLAPGRLLDSRNGTGTTQSKWAAGQTRSVQVTGVQGVPASGVSAVVLNVTVTGATATSHLRTFPTGTALPNASSINFEAGQTIANGAVVKVGTGGKIDIFNNSGQVEVIADVVGYYDKGSTTGDKYTPLAPGRLLDSRNGTGTTQSKWTARQTRSVQVTGVQGVPASGVSAVVLNVTVTGATATSHLRTFPTGTALPNASSINFEAGQTIANGAVVKVGTGGKIDIFNNSGQVEVIADVVGYYGASGDVFTPLAPGRLLDSRNGTGTTQSKWAAGQTRGVQITGQQGVPATGVTAVVLNLTVTGPTAPSHLRTFPTGTALPNASSINFEANQTIANLVVVKVGTGGKVDIFNNSGQVDVIADVVGYFS